MIILGTAAYSLSVSIPRFEDPLSVSVYINTTVNLSDIEDAYDNWDYMEVLDTYRSYHPNYAEINIVYSDIPTGVSGRVTRVGNTDMKQITLYQSWNSLSSLQRREVVAHEMGHCWGLAHGNPDALMRASGFNGSAHPKADDIKGIEVLYGGGSLV